MRDIKITNRITERRESVTKYFSDISKYELLTVEEEVELAELSKNGDQKATERLIKANLRFVVSVAKQYLDPSVELQDLIQAGNLGIIEAARRFDPSRGFKFISYAVWWIRQSINVELANKHSIRLPQNKRSEISINNRKNEVINQKIQNGDLSDIYNIEHVEFSYVARHLSDEMGENDTLEDILTNYRPGDEDKELLNGELHDVFLSLFMTRLSSREAYVIRNSFGIGCLAISLEEIGENIGLTRERARQIKESAIRKLKGIKGLKQYFN